MARNLKNNKNDEMNCGEETAKKYLKWAKNIQSNYPIIVIVMFLIIAAATQNAIIGIAFSIVFTLYCVILIINLEWKAYMLKNLYELNKKVENKNK